jgi:hypothetical protein
VVVVVVVVVVVITRLPQSAFATGHVSRWWKVHFLVWCNQIFCCFSDLKVACILPLPDHLLRPQVMRWELTACVGIWLHDFLKLLMPQFPCLLKQVKKFY